jgi:hypothetical protein
MHRITLLEGEGLTYLLDVLGMPKENRPYRLRIWQADNNTAKFKVNEGMWSPTLGALEEVH